MKERLCLDAIRLDVALFSKSRTRSTATKAKICLLELEQDEKLTWIGRGMANSGNG
jgi:hypothetical protein